MPKPQPPRAPTRERPTPTGLQTERPSPLGDAVVLMPPLAIAAEELEELLEITADSITAATESQLAAAA